MSVPPVDIAIIGAGAAGLELARLASRANLRVVLFEQGLSNGRHLFQRIPLMVGKIIGNRKFVDSRQSVAQSAAAGRALPMLSGRGLGGSSRVNGNVAYAGPGWRYRQIFAPLGLDFDPILTQINHGAPRVASWSDALSQHFLQASQQPIADPDDAFHSASVLHVNTRRGWRHNHLENCRQTAKHENIYIIRRPARKITFEGHRAIGVQFEGGAILADKIVLAAGAIGSPDLLMHSGVGDAGMLECAGIDPLLDQPQVGQHLKDHANLRLAFSCPQYDTLNQKTRGVKALWEGVKFLLGRENSILRGPGASAGVNFVNDGNDFRIQLVHFTQDRSVVGAKGIVFERSQKASLGMYPLWPKSEGAVGLTPDGVQINPGFLTDPTDVQTTLDAMQTARALIEQMGFAADPVEGSDEAIIRQGVYSGYHLIGSNRMSPDAQSGVVAADFAVHGLEGLSVCDASVLPDHLSSHSYLPTIAMARMFGQQRGWL